MREKILWLSLSRVKGVGIKTLWKIYSTNERLKVSLEDFLAFSEPDIVAQYGLKPKIAHEISRLQEPESLIKGLEENEIDFLTPSHPSYPKTLKEIPNPPFILYYKGNLDLLKNQPIAIMGSRNTSPKGLEIIYGFARILEEQRLTIIRGAKLDVAMITKLASETSKGVEVVVLSNGILRFLGKEKDIDFHRVLLLSFVNPYLEWRNYNEVKRNRIISALADRIVIVEARKESITMKEGLKAMERDKKVFVVRYEEYPESAKGNPLLIEKGTKPISSSISLRNLEEVMGVETPGRSKKEWGQFFTPLRIIEFMYEMIKNIWSDNPPSDPKIIDPACGKGVFLKYPLDNGITKGDNLYGCDFDEKVKKDWETVGIRNRIKLFTQDGLLDNRDGIACEKFDLVIGNPPYGGVGLKELAHISPEETRPSLFIPLKKEDEVTKISKAREEELRKLLKTLQSYELWKEKGPKMGKNELPPPLFPQMREIKTKEKRRKLIAQRVEILRKFEKTIPSIDKKSIKKLLSFPIEVLFLERFIRLTKPGGIIAIIIPDGILANVNLNYVRDWLFYNTQILAIISLPRETFKYLGTTAKTSVLFLRKLKSDENPDFKKEIFLAGAEYVGVNNKGNNDLPAILGEFKKFLKTGKVKKVKMSPFYGKANAKQMMKVWRMDPEYWTPEYRKMIRALSKKYKTRPLENFVVYITYGQVGRKSVGETGDVQYIQVKNLIPTGIDFCRKPAKVKENSWNDPERSRIKINDILFSRNSFGGMSTLLGRVAVAVKDYGKVNISEDIDLIRVKNINPYYLGIFLKSKYGQSQIQRMKYGVRSIKLNFSQVKSIQIPLLPDSIQKKIQREYKKISKWHDKAMGRKEELIDEGLSNKEAEKDSEYQRCIQKAEAMLKDLIKKTEEIIEGKRRNL